jgi:hypothetical protein
MNSKQLSILLGIIVVILLAIIGYLVWGNNSQTDTLDQQNTAPNNNAIENNKDTQTPADSDSNWQVYTNNALGFSVEYPNDMPVNLELNDEYNRLVKFGSSDNKFFEVRLEKDTDPDVGKLYGFLGAEVSSEDVTLGGVKGFKAVSKTGYGDAGYQGSPYVVFAARLDGNVYHLIFYGDATVSAEENKILSTFKFIK